MAFSYEYTRYSAIAQIILGGLSIIFGAADRATIYEHNAFHTESVVPIWMGAWIVLTGIIGCCGSSPSYSHNGRASRSLIGTYLGFSIVSNIFASTIIILYILGLLFVVTDGSPCKSRSGGETRYEGGQTIFIKKSLEKACNTSVALGSIIIILAALEFGVAIWASICACNNGCCDCCEPPQQPQNAHMFQSSGQVVYVQTQHGPVAYIMTQGANGVPVALPLMPGQVPLASIPVNQAADPVLPGYSLPNANMMQNSPASGNQGMQSIPGDVTLQNNIYTPLENKPTDMPPVYQP